MDYVFTFIEGIASFISPCILPMLPIYISYFIGEDNKKASKALINSIGFVLGFTIIFILLSIFASKFGGIISNNIKYVKIVFGIIIILFGLNYMELIKIKFLIFFFSKKKKKKNLNFIKYLTFVILFLIN